MSTFGPYPARLLRIHDGDTLSLSLDLGFDVSLATRCRVYGINAPELSTQAGKDARDYVYHLVAVGNIYHVISHGWDKYGGRFDGSITLPDGSDFGTRMVAAGHAVAYAATPEEF